MCNVVLIRSNPVSPDPPVEKVASCLVKNGYNVRILAWDRGEKYKEKNVEMEILGEKIPVTLFGIPAQFGARYNNVVALTKFQYRISKWLRKHKDAYDIIHAFDFDTGFIAQRHVKNNQKKLVYHILDFYIDSHGLKDNFLGRIIKKCEIKLINAADYVIICTEQRKDQIIGSSPKNLSIIHNTPQKIDYELDKCNLQSYSPRCRIVYVGILAGGRFIDKIAEVVASDKRFEFHVGGYGMLNNKMLNYAEKYDNIFFYGKLPYSKTLSLEKQCDIMTAIYDPDIPNHKYAAPNKFYESLMLGKPVIMVKGTGFDNIVEEENIGCVIDYSLESLKNGLNELLDKREEWKSMGIRGQQLYDKYYSWEIMEDRLINIYHKLKIEKNNKLEKRDVL